MKYIFTLFLLVFICRMSSAQSVYNSTSYAAIGDTVYLTTAQPDTTNYYAGGAGYTWNFKGLKGISQQTLAFRNPKSTGFTQLQWNYIYNTANVNLSSTNGQSVAIGPLTETNNNDYYLKSSSALVQKASSFSVAYNSVAVNVKNTYTTADTVYKFPLHYSDTFASTSGYTTTIPGVYYSMQTLQRTTKVDGWGTVTTPFGTFTHCIRVVSMVVQKDTFAFYGAGIPAVTVQYREIKWLDSTKKYPVLYVKQTKTGSSYITAQVQYFDGKQYFQPQALFAYLPLLPVVNDTLTFQNLSVNATAYKWLFGDGDSSALANPQHVFTAAGAYPVKLIAYNGSLTDTTVISIKITSSPNALFAYTPALPLVNDTVKFTNFSLNSTSCHWSFGDGSASTNINPQHIYTKTGNYAVQLIAYGNNLADTLTEYVKVSSATLPVKLVSFTATPVKGYNQLQWSTTAEINTSYFTVQRSADGKSFDDIISLPAAGNSSSMQYYSYSDAGNTAGSTYYRLKTTDKDGQASYSNVLLLQNAQALSKAMVLYPNPVPRNSNATLLVSTGDAITILATIYNIQGKTLLGKQVLLVKGINNVDMPLNGLIPGVYFLVCRNMAGAVIGQTSFLVQ